jgi:cytochrome oxidase Cu insertion factor (SCO1/SenC/PrrC family)
MITSMSATAQPHALSALVRNFATFVAGHGFAVNLIAVIGLAGVGAAFLSGRRRLRRPALLVFLAFCLTDWVLVEDLGFFGGLGTDPNSMIPVALLAVSGYLALTPAPQAAAVPAVESSAEPTTPAPGRVGAGTMLGVRALLALWAAGVVIIGAGPMAAAQASRNASPIIAQAIDGSAAPLNFAAPAFSLIDQTGHAVSLASMHGKVVLLTFLDPVCTSDCPLVAQEFRAADQLLGADARGVEMVAVVANPDYRSVAYTRAFDRQEGMSSLPNWLFLTGSLAQLQQAWKHYGIAAEAVSAGGMIAHNDVAFVIDKSGRTRAELNFDPGPGTQSSQSSFAGELAAQARSVMGQA